MENAAKALLMAGGVLIALLVIGLAIFGWNNFSAYKTQEEKLKEIDQAYDFNTKIESYATDLYGSELISLTNFIEDYNNNDANSENGYTAISFSARVTSINRTFTDPQKLNQYYYGLVPTIKPIDGKKIEEWVRIFQIFEKKSSMNWTDQDKVDYIKENFPEVKDKINITRLNYIGQQVENYKEGLQKQEEFALKLFDGKFQYDNKTGRITKMSYTEK